MKDLKPAPAAVSDDEGGFDEPAPAAPEFTFDTSAFDMGGDEPEPEEKPKKKGAKKEDKKEKKGAKKGKKEESGEALGFDLGLPEADGGEKKTRGRRRAKEPAALPTGGVLGDLSDVPKRPKKKAAKK